MNSRVRLVGREPVLAAAAAVLRDAAAGRGQLLLISGEAGIGKTAVLAALVDQAGRDWTVLRGICSDRTGAPPYWPWAQVLRATALPLAGLGEAARLVEPEPRPADDRPMDAGAAADAEFRVFDAVGQCLSALAAERPVLVILDDLHWADSASLRLLGFLARALTGSRVLMVGAYRDADAADELLTVSADAEHLHLSGLGAEQVRELVAAIAGPSEQLAAQICERSAGNPFFVRELARLMIAHGSTGQHPPIPASIAETLRRRLARLSTDCVRLLERVAVAGREIDPQLLVRTGAAAGEAEVSALLDEARRAGVVTGGPDDPRLAHDLYRETILSGLNPITRAEIDLAIGSALQDRPGSAARVAGHLLAAGSQARRKAVEYSVLAAREATARLGHEDACGHYRRALQVIDSVDATDVAWQPPRADLLVELADAYARAGRTDQARKTYLTAADGGRATGDAVAVARCALGIQSLGHRSGAHDTEALELLDEAADRLATAQAPLSLQSRVHAAKARLLRHGSIAVPDGTVVGAAERAVELATAADDDQALAEARLALHDSLWRPGTAARRLPLIAAMLDAATAAHDADLVAQAHQLRAAALLELGEPFGRDELLTYIALASQLGHARGRWGALTRRATFAQLAGQAEEASRLGEEALELGLAIGEPDAVGCFCTSRWALVALGIRELDSDLDQGDPLWPMFPLMKAWPPAARGELAAARDALGDFSVLDIAVWTGLEGLAVAAVVFAAVGTAAQRAWIYDQLRPYAGTHVVVGGCASYHAAVDHHLGALAHSLGDLDAAEKYFRSALIMHERLGAAGWTRITEQALASLAQPINEFRPANGLWLLAYAGVRTQVPDSKGLRDLALLIGAQGNEVHVSTLIGPEFVNTGADPVLDETAKAQYKVRLTDLAEQIEEAQDADHADQAETLRAERDALIHELAAAAGLSRRTRRLGDPVERARKTVSARVRDALAKLDHAHPALADHLRTSIQLGTACSYTPKHPTTWRLR